MSGRTRILRVEELEQRQTPSAGIAPPVPRWNLDPPPGMFSAGPAMGGNIELHGPRDFVAPLRMPIFVTLAVPGGRGQRVEFFGGADQSSTRFDAGQPASQGTAIPSGETGTSIAIRSSRPAQSMAGINSADAMAVAMIAPRAQLAPAGSANGAREPEGIPLPPAERPSAPGAGSGAEIEPGNLGGKSPSASVVPSLPQARALAAMPAASLAAIHRGMQELIGGLDSAARQIFMDDDGLREWILAGAAVVAACEIARRQARRHVLTAEPIVDLPPTTVPIE